MKKIPEVSQCLFSNDRLYRYSLLHAIHPSVEPQRLIAWICLNPSTADENSLDPTLRRIKGFSEAWGYTHFVVLNIFAWRATRPADLKTAHSPVGRNNDRWIKTWTNQAEMTVVGWGEHGSHQGRSKQVTPLLDLSKTFCLGINRSGEPKHPLYIAQGVQPTLFHERRP